MTSPSALFHAITSLAVGLATYGTVQWTAAGLERIWIPAAFSMGFGTWLALWITDPWWRSGREGFSTVLKGLTGLVLAHALAALILVLSIPVTSEQEMILGHEFTEGSAWIVGPAFMFVMSIVTAGPLTLIAFFVALAWARSEVSDR